MEVTEGPDGMLQRRLHRHIPILSCFEGDTPALNGIANDVSHSGYLACSFCTIRGVWEGGMYFPGYAAPTSGGVRFATVHREPCVQIFENDASIWADGCV